MEHPLLSPTARPYKRKRRRWLYALSAAALLLIALGFAAFWKLTDFHHVAIDRSDEALGIQPLPVAAADPNRATPVAQTGVASGPDAVPLAQTTAAQAPKPAAGESADSTAAAASAVKSSVRNIALFGLDRRSPKERGRSDVMMILTIDETRHKLKLTSLMRDLYVPIDGHGHAKLNAAYAYGGPQLAIKTINQVFGTDIRDYAAVDFGAMGKVIDAIGGVSIDVEPDELDVLNAYLANLSDSEGVPFAPVEKGGEQTLSGIQAVAYSRIRYVGNADFERTERQRRVLSAMIDRLKQKGASAVPGLLLKLSPIVETSLGRSDLLSLAYGYLKETDMTLETNRYPEDGTWSSGRTKSGEWILETDLTALKKSAQQYLYFDSKLTNAGDAT